MEISRSNLITIARKPYSESAMFDISSGNDLCFQVRVEKNKGRLFGLLSRTEGWRAIFENPEFPLSIIINTHTPFGVFHSPEGEKKGEMNEAAWSIMGKTVVKDERDLLLGWIESKLAKHIAYSRERTRLGTFVRTPMVKRKIYPPSKAYLLERFELIRESSQEIDWRIIYAFVACRIFSEKTSGS